MGSYPEQLMEERETLSAAIETTVNTAGESGQGLSDDDKKQIETRQARVKAIDSELTIIANEQDSLRKANEFAARFMRTPKPPAEEREAARKMESTGQAFVGSEEFRSYDFHGKVGMEVTEEGAWFETRAPLMTTDLPKMIGTGTFAIAEPTEATPLFGLIGSEQVSSGSFEYVSYTLTNNAAVVPEGTVKPESELVENIVPGTLETVAHWTQVTRQTLEDSSRVRSIIDGKLRDGVNKKVHDQIVAALLAANLPTVAGDTLLASIRLGVATVQVAGFAPNAVLLNPMDWAELDLSVMDGTVNGPVRQQSFWGMTPVPSAEQAAGTATVGNFKAGATLFYRSGVGVFATDSHADTFTSNIFTILAERRAKPAVTQPDALCECTVTPRGSP